LDYETPNVEEVLQVSDESKNRKIPQHDWNPRGLPNTKFVSSNDLENRNY
jgi:hypothetical protein